LLVVSAIVTIISVGAVYRSSLNAEQARLVEMVRSQVRFINAVAQFYAQFSAGDHLGGSAAATLSHASRVSVKAASSFWDGVTVRPVCRP
jgi:hypothetical protein